MAGQSGSSDGARWYYLLQLVFLFLESIWWARRKIVIPFHVVSAEVVLQRFCYEPVSKTKFLVIFAMKIRKHK